MPSDGFSLLSQAAKVRQSIQGLYKLNAYRYKGLYDKSEAFYRAVQSNNLDEMQSRLNDFLQEAEKHRGYSRYIRETPILKTMFYGLTVITNMCRLLWKWEPWTKDAVFMDKKTNSSKKVLGIKSEMNKIEEQVKANEPFNSFLGAKTDYQAIQKCVEVADSLFGTPWLMTLDKDPCTMTPDERGTCFGGKPLLVLFHQQLYFIHPLETEPPIPISLKPGNEHHVMSFFNIEMEQPIHSTAEQFKTILNSIEPADRGKISLGADDSIPIMIQYIQKKLKTQELSLDELKKLNSSAYHWQFPQGNKIVFKESIDEVTGVPDQIYPVSVMTRDGLFQVSLSAIDLQFDIKELLNQTELKNLNLDSYNKWVDSSNQTLIQAEDNDLKKIDLAIYSKDPTLQILHMIKAGSGAYNTAQYCAALYNVTHELISNKISSQNDEASDVTEAPIPTVAAVDENNKLEEQRLALLSQCGHYIRSVQMERNEQRHKNDNKAWDDPVRISSKSAKDRETEAKQIKALLSSPQFSESTLVKVKKKIERLEDWPLFSRALDLPRMQQQSCKDQMNSLRASEEPVVVEKKLPGDGMR